MDLVFTLVKTINKCLPNFKQQFNWFKHFIKFEQFELFINFKLISDEIDWDI